MMWYVLMYVDISSLCMRAVILGKAQAPEWASYLRALDKRLRPMRGLLSTRLLA